MSAQGYRSIARVGGWASSKVSGDGREKGRGLKHHIQINVEAILLPKLLQQLCRLRCRNILLVRRTIN